MPGLFALCFEVIGNLQMATFAAFGGFATLVLADFGGTRRDRLVAHAGLAAVGSVLLTIGTAVNSATALAAVVTLLVGFSVLFLGILGPNAASGATAALLAYVLPAASPGTVSMIPSRLAGWLLVSAVGTVAVLLTSTRPSGGRLRTAIATSADALADELEGAARRQSDPARRDRSLAAKRELRAAFTAGPFRPTGMATRDQAVGNVIEVLEWATELVGDTVNHHASLAVMPPGDRELLREAANTLRGITALVTTGRATVDVAGLEDRRRQRAAASRGLPADTPDLVDVVHAGFHARTVAIAVRNAAADALIASRMASPQLVASQRLRWLGVNPPADGGGTRRLAAPRAVARDIGRHASLRSVWLRNSARGGLALAAAVAVADLSNVQHGFWVVLGTLSVLRTNATSTGATALRAVAGTTLGFIVGAGVVLAIGTNTDVLWAVLPVSVLVAGYTASIGSFVVGQAAFTLVVTVLYNLLVPVGWTVGVVRIEDVAVGCGVSVVVGVLLWPRGASSVVATDLHDAFLAGAGYLDQAASWVLGVQPAPPEGGVAAVSAGVRLDDALRGYLTERGSKRVRREDLWRLVGAVMRLRLTASSLAGMAPIRELTAQGRALDGDAATLAQWYRALAGHLARAQPPHLEPVAMSSGQSAQIVAQGLDICGLLDVDHHLRHLHGHLPELIAPAGRMAQQGGKPWWR